MCCLQSATHALFVVQSDDYRPNASEPKTCRLPRGCGEFAAWSPFHVSYRCSSPSPAHYPYRGQRNFVSAQVASDSVHWSVSAANRFADETKKHCECSFFVRSVTSFGKSGVRVHAVPVQLTEYYLFFTTANSPSTQFAAEARGLDAAERKAGIRGHHSVDEHHACVQFLDEAPLLCRNRAVLPAPGAERQSSPGE